MSPWLMDGVAFFGYAPKAQYTVTLNVPHTCGSCQVNPFRIYSLDTKKAARRHKAPIPAASDFESFHGGKKRKNGAS